jgi:membrane associated rhomboid family serine protease
MIEIPAWFAIPAAIVGVIMGLLLVGSMAREFRHPRIQDSKRLR